MNSVFCLVKLGMGGFVHTSRRREDGDAERQFKLSKNKRTISSTSRVTFGIPAKRFNIAIYPILYH